MNIDFTIEVLRALVAAVLMIYLWRIGVRNQLILQKGWRLIIIGFSLILFATLLDITDNFPGLNQYVVIGDTNTESFLEKIVGYLGGFIVLFIGFTHWLPLIHKLRITEAELRNKTAELELKVLSRTAELKKKNTTLESEAKRLSEAENALLKEESRLRATIESAMDAVVQMNAEGFIIGWSNQAEKIFGWPKEEVIGRALHEMIIPQQYREAHVLGLKHFLLTGEGPVLNSRIEIIGLHRDGHEFPIELSIAALRVGDKHEFSAFIRNLSERKQAELDLRISAIAFESHESLIITDAQGVILRVNQAFTETTGYTAEDAVGQTPRLLKSGRHNAAFYAEMWETINRTGTWQGEIWDKRKNGEIFPKWLTITAIKGDDGAVIHYVGLHIDITERKAAEEKIQHLAFYDSLTNLPNRRLLMDRLQQALASSARFGREGALLFLDLDNFKVLNDTLGHDTGDLLLQQVAERLKSCVREGDTVARLGGDEFVLLLEALSNDTLVAAEQTEAIGEKILAALNQPYQLDKHECNSSTSIGAVLFSDHQASMEELMKQADIAMYQAKKAGRNTLRFFNPKMQEAVDSHAALETDIRSALVQQQFQLHYQIQVDSSYHPFGAEALIRWIHPERGFVSPAQFIPVAEETGLILPIGRWVLETACAQLKAWERNALTRDLALAVNVSAKQFRQTEFVAQVKATVQRYAIKPNLLKLELTESLFLEDIEDTITTMNALKEVGIQFSLDDFGTGYSSLQYLKRLPLDQLKIDQSFVRDIATDNSDKAIVKTIIAMAHSMDIGVIAEGVETEEQRQLLLDEGCMHYQGYLFAKPVSLEQFEASLKNN